MHFRPVAVIGYLDAMGTAVRPPAQDVPAPSGGQDDSTSAVGTPSHLRLDVQGLRAVAVLLVVAFHAGLPVRGGFIGVDVFLVISGFVITGMLLREIEKTGTVRLRHFYARRIKRLLPALALLTTAVMALSFLLDQSLQAQETTASTGLGATYLAANVVIYNESIEYFSPVAETNPLLHTWTLSVEEQTYLVFPSLLLASWVVARMLRRSSPAADQNGDPPIVGRRSLRASRRGVAAMLVAIGVASFVVSYQVSMHRTSTPAAWAFYSSLARVWEFAVGAGLALAAGTLRRIRPAVALVLGVAGAVTIAIGAITLSGDVPYPGAAALLPVLGAAAVIAAGFRSTSIVPRALATRPMVKIGDASYSLYLWHWPLIVFAGVLWPGRPWVLVAAAVVSVVPALGSYLGVERPIRGNQTIRGRRVLWLLAVCVLVPTVAGLTLLIGARSSWGNEDVERMQEQVGKEHAGERLGCDEGASGQVDTGTTCEINAGSKRTKVYLFGNSIAAMYSEALIGATKKLDLPLSLDTHSGGFCATIDAEGCQDMFVDSFDELLNGGKSGVIVMSGTWDLGAFGGDLTAEDLTRDIGGLITALHDAGHHVLIVLPTPRFFYGEEPGTFAPAPVNVEEREPHATVWRPQNCPTSIAESDPTACGATLDEDAVEASQALTMTTLRQIAEDTGASTLYLRPRYCTDGVCATNDGNFWMFEDGLHISVDESQALAPTFARVLDDIIERRSEGKPLGYLEYTYRAGDVSD